MKLKKIPAYVVDLGNGEKLTYRSPHIAEIVARQYRDGTVEPTFTHVRA